MSTSNRSRAWRGALLASALVAVSATGCSHDEGAAAEPPVPGATDGAAASPLPAEQRLDLRVEHANGTSVLLRGVAFHDDRIEADMVVANGAGFDVHLAGGGDMDLRDDLGNVYRLSPPEGNDDVTVRAGTTVEGRFVFAGRISPQARLLTLGVNRGGPGTGTDSRAPLLSIDAIPVGTDGG